MKPPAKAWDYFVRSGGSTICQVEITDKTTKLSRKCNKSLCYSSSTTSTMRSHLKSQHNIVIENKTAKLSSTNVSTLKQTTIKFPKKQTKSLGEILARCAAVDGMSLNAIKDSDVVKDSVEKVHHHRLPNSATTIKEKILGFHKEAVKEYKEIFDGLKSNDSKFSITTDEWTNMLRLKRCLNITIHCKIDSKIESFKLGLKSIVGRTNAQDYSERVTERLAKFGFDFKSDIVASTHDGARMMLNYGELVDSEAQICLNHGIHLAVTKVFYPKKDKKAEEISSQQDKDDDQDDDIDIFDEFESETDKLLTDESSYKQLFAPNNLFDEVDDFLPDDIVPTEEVQGILKWTRKLAKYFRSPVTNTFLQKYVLEVEKNELKCLLDVPNRWNSIISMAERILRLKPYISKALTDLKFKDKLFNERMFEKLQQIVSCLKPLEEAVLALAKRDANLLTADTIMKYVFTKLRKVNSELSTQLIVELKKVYEERRNKKLVSLLYFLKYHKCPPIVGFEGFRYSSKSEIFRTAKALYDRLFAKDDEVPDKLDSNLSNDRQPREELHLLDFLNEECENNEISSNNHDLTNELKMVEVTKTLSPELNKLYNALLTIQPTSTPSEQAFSVASFFVTKIRNRMEFELLDALVFLKYYFLKKDGKENKKEEKESRKLEELQK